MKFSANLGFLWSELSLPKAILAAKAAGFDAVECHWPYDTPPNEVADALAETGLSMLGLNTHRGDVNGGENGLAALPGREADARAAIDEALTYAVAIKAENVHVMAGFASGSIAHNTFLSNLRYACAQAANHNITILIEPLNHYGAPGYFLTTTTQAKTVIDAVDATNLRLMFDCYNVQLMEGDLTHRLHDLRPLIGHIQIASVPDRGAPDHGEINYAHVFAEIVKTGWGAPIGAEYKPNGPTDETLGWFSHARM